MRDAQKFLDKKQQVRVQLVRLRGRENDRVEDAAGFLNDLYDNYLVAHGSQARPATAANLSFTLNPRK